MFNFNQAVGEWDSSTITEIQQYIKSSYVNIHKKTLHSRQVPLC